MLPLLTLNSSHAALSAQTVKVIQGSEPYLVLADGTKVTNINHLLGLWMPKQNGSSGTEFIEVARQDVLIAPKGMKLRDVQTIVVADNQAHTLPTSYQKDDDGDNGSSLGSITGVWKVNDQVVSDLNQTLTPCGAYTLTMSTDNIQAQTTYGIPHQGDNYGSVTKTYSFISSDMRICYIKPQSMEVFKDGGVYPQGYNPAVWDAGKGFSVSKMNAVGKQFPTTGFDKAVFDLIGTGSDQRKYFCSKTGDWVNLSGSASYDVGQNCRVTYHYDSKQSKPQTPVKLDMYYKDDYSGWRMIGSYTIPVPQKWAISPVGVFYQAQYAHKDDLSGEVQFDALDACRKVGSRADNKTTSIAEGRGQMAENRAVRQRFMYRRDELTNSIYADRTKYPEGAGRTLGVGYYSRDIGTFMGEWGYVKYYDQSPWSVIHIYWTAEALGREDHQHTVLPAGDIHHYPSDESNAVAICRGE